MASNVAEALLEMSTEVAAPEIDPITTRAYASYRELANARNISEYKMETRPVSAVGENSYGTVQQVTLIPTLNNPTLIPVQSFVSILKIAPKGDARRDHMKVRKYYQREVFMFDKVLPMLAGLRWEGGAGVAMQEAPSFDAIPQMYAYSLVEMDEFIIFEDLSQSDYSQNPRLNMPTFDLVCAALGALAQLHARSLVLQHRKPKEFKALTEQLSDNLYTKPMEVVTVEFAKYYIERTRSALEEQGTNDDNRKLIQLTEILVDQFEEVALKCVDGKADAPYAVICHGDFSNNNIMYKHNEERKATSAKLIDFQMSRYSSPVCDVLRYIFTCTEKTLRDNYFQEFLDFYHNSLVQQFGTFGNDLLHLYPRDVFDRQLADYGIYALVISSFSMPFLVSIKGEFPDLDKVAEDIQNVAQSSARKFVEENNLLTPRSTPIFKRRMIGIVQDLVKYKMVDKVLKT